MFIDLPSTNQNVKSPKDLTLNKKRSITKAGEEAKVFVQLYIKEAQRIVVRSSRSDKYDRYLADVFLPSEDGNDFFLNNLLLENGHAVRM